MTGNAALRLSAVRAFLGIIRPEYRRVNVEMDESCITVELVTDAPLSEDATEQLSLATTEIIADFPDCMIREIIEVSTGALAPKDPISDGVIYQRWEA